MIEVQRREVHESVNDVFECSYTVSLYGSLLGSFYKMAGREEYSNTSLKHAYFTSKGAAVAYVLSTAAWEKSWIIDAFNAELEV